MDKNAMALGLRLGMILAGLRKIRKVVAYLYNGIELPVLPERDVTLYPHVAVVRTGSEGSNYKLFLDATFEATSDGRIVRLFAQEQDYAYKDGVWSEESGGGLNHYVVWTNKDLYYSEDAGGGLFMEGTEPVPVYK